MRRAISSSGGSATGRCCPESPCYRECRSHPGLPEYNYGFNAPLKNAVDYLHHEWAHKPVGFVSYGGVSAGMRAVQMLKQVVTALKMVPLNEAVSIPFVRQFIDDEGRVQPNETMNAAADQMLDELSRWTEVLQPLRERELATV